MTNEFAPQDPSDQAWGDLALAIGDFQPYASSTTRMRLVAAQLEGPEGAAPLSASAYIREVNGSIADQSPITAAVELQLPSQSIGKQTMQAAIAARIVELAALLPAEEVAWLQTAQEIANESGGHTADVGRVAELLDGPYPLNEQSTFQVMRNLDQKGRVHVRHADRNQICLDRIARDMRPHLFCDSVTIREPDAHGARVFQYRSFVDGSRQLKITDPNIPKEAGARPNARPTEDKVRALTAALRYAFSVL